MNEDDIVSKAIRTVVIALAMLLSACNVIAQPATVEDAGRMPIDRMDEVAVEGMMGTHFTLNMGQVSDKDVLFQSEHAYFTSSSVIFRVLKEEEREDLASFDLMDGRPAKRMHVYKVDFVGANDVVPVGADILSHSKNFFIGNDASRWATNVPNYGSLVYEGLYDGIDLVYYGVPEGLKYEFVVHPGGDVKDIVLEVVGADVETDGSILEIGTPLRTVVDGDLYIYQEVDEKRIQQDGRFIVKGNRVMFDADYDRTRTLVIDPLVLSTYLGGSDRDTGYSIALDPEDNIYVAGTTESTDFPTKPGSYDTVFNGGWRDIFVTKLTPDADQLLFSTYIGGSDDDTCAKIILDQWNNTYVGGSTTSTDFPTTLGAYDTVFAGNNVYDDAYLVRLNTSGAQLDFGTFLGGDGFDWLSDIEWDSSGNIIITGTTEATDFPTTAGAFMETAPGGQRDIFVTKMKNDGSDIINSTYIGGNNWDHANGMVLDDDDNIYITGMVDSSDFPTTANAYNKFLSNMRDAFVFKMDPDLGDLNYSTYIGGTGEDAAYDIDIDDSNDAFVVGCTGSNNFPTSVGAIDSTYNGGGMLNGDGFALKLTQNGSELNYSTYIGSNTVDFLVAVIVGPSGNASVMGYTDNFGFDTVEGSYDTTYNGNGDIVYLVINENASALNYGTFIGGGAGEAVGDFILGPSDTIYITGGTLSDDFPVTNDTYDQSRNGENDAFILKLGQPDLPEAPLLFASEGNGFVDLNWTPGDDGGATIIAQRVYKGNTSDTLALLTVLGKELEYHDTDVINAQTYYYAVSGVNVAGDGPLSNIVEATPGWTPSAPRNLTLDHGYEYVNVSWLPPSDDGGFEVTAYVIFRGPTFDNITPITTIDTTLYFNDTGVTNGVEYYYSVAGVNAKGEGARPPAQVAWPGGPPSTPINFTAVPGVGNVELNWSPPMDDGGYLVTKYNVYRGPDADDLEVLAVRPIIDGYSDNSVETGLTYHYAVSAENSIGEGPLTKVINVTAGGLPSCPMDVLVDDGDGYVALSWSPPADDGGVTVTGYRVYKGLEMDDFSLFENSTTTGLNDTSVENGNIYYYGISAVNPIGEGAQCPPVAGLPGMVPAAPVLTGTPADGLVKLNWTPGDDGGFNITGYRVYRSTPTTGLVFLKNVTGDNHEDRDVENGMTYQYAVSAVNIKGEGLKSEAVEVTPVEVTGPIELHAIRGDGWIALIWNPPENRMTSMVEGYTIFKGASEDHLSKLVDVTEAGFNDTNVTNGVTYFYRVVGFNSLGPGILSNIVNATPGKVPGQPVGLEVKASSDKVVLDWEIPVNDGGSRITEYRVYRGTSEDGMVVIGTTQDLTFKDKDMKQGKKYYYKVTAVNVFGEGDPSDTVKGKVSVSVALDNTFTLMIIVIVIAVVVSLVLLLRFNQIRKKNDP